MWRSHQVQKRALRPDFARLPNYSFLAQLIHSIRKTATLRKLEQLVFCWHRLINKNPSFAIGWILLRPSRANLVFEIYHEKSLKNHITLTVLAQMVVSTSTISTVYNLRCLGYNFEEFSRSNGHQLYIGVLGYWFTDWTLTLDSNLIEHNSIC